ncbi:MAG: hypothetical protein ACE1Y4_06095 [Lysobacterales bacterium]
MTKESDKKKAKQPNVLVIQKKASDNTDDVLAENLTSPVVQAGMTTRSFQGKRHFKHVLSFR